MEVFENGYEEAMKTERVEGIGRAPVFALSLFMAASSLLASCGAGVAAVAASSDSGGGGSTPALTAFEVETPKVSPTRLRFDANQAVRVALSFVDPSAGPDEHPMTLTGVAGNEVNLPAGESFVRWEFEPDLGSTSFGRQPLRAPARRSTDQRRRAPARHGQRSA